MKRLSAIFAALLLLTSCRESLDMPDNRPASQEHPPMASDAVPTNEELLAYAEEHLAAYRYHDAAAWAYELKRRNKRPRINGRPIIGMPKPVEAVSRSRFGGNAG